MIELGEEILQLEEMLKGEVPCMGVAATGIPPCGRSAVMRYAGFMPPHLNVPHNVRAPLKCAVCYAKYYAYIAREIDRAGAVGCVYCHAICFTVEQLGTYVPL